MRVPYIGQKCKRAKVKVSIILGLVISTNDPSTHKKSPPIMGTGKEATKSLLNLCNPFTFGPKRSGSQIQPRATGGRLRVTGGTKLYTGTQTPPRSDVQREIPLQKSSSPHSSAPTAAPECWPLHFQNLKTYMVGHSALLSFQTSDGNGTGSSRDVRPCRLQTPTQELPLSPEAGPWMLYAKRLVASRSLLAYSASSL